MSTDEHREVVGDEKHSKPGVRKRAAAIRPFRCKNLIAVIEDPEDIKNIGTVIRNVNALGVEKVYIVDPKHSLADDWQDEPPVALRFERRENWASSIEPEDSAGLFAQSGIGTNQ